VSGPAGGTTAGGGARPRRVLVTGGTRGLGLAIARGFVRAGATVVVTSRKRDACDEAEALLRADGDATAVAADLSTPDGRDLVADLIAGRGPLDVLVNNAGATWGAPLQDYPVAAFGKLWALNVEAVFALTQRLLPALRAASAPDAPARVLNIGSVDGLVVPHLETYAYSATKSAVHTLTRHLAARLAPEVTVNAIAPGPFLSKMTEATFGGEGRAAVERRVPMGRLGRDEDIAALAGFLAGPGAPWLTGVVVPLDGGMTLGVPSDTYDSEDRP
jgi:NAD(P)-dependent dehydrogenase (short-subunit alcohol dehydrogenase family)